MDSHWKQQAAWCTRGFGVVEKEKFLDKDYLLEKSFIDIY